MTYKTASKRPNKSSDLVAADLQECSRISSSKGPKYDAREKDKMPTYRGHIRRD